MHLALELATPDDALEIAALRQAAAQQLNACFGEGPWAKSTDTPAAVALEVGGEETYVARLAGTIVTALRLKWNAPWVGETHFFTARERPLHLTAMAVAPMWQRRGFGREAMRQAWCIATALGADALRLDTYDAPAGAGPFYQKCGFREAGRTRYLGVPLRWFERSN